VCAQIYFEFIEVNRGKRGSRRVSLDLPKYSSTIGNVHPTHAYSWPKASSTIENVDPTPLERVSAYGWPKASSSRKCRLSSGRRPASDLIEMSSELENYLYFHSFIASSLEISTSFTQRQNPQPEKLFFSLEK